jgi:hypothetical protein
MIGEAHEPVTRERGFFLVGFLWGISGKKGYAIISFYFRKKKSPIIKYIMEKISNDCYNGFQTDGKMIHPPLGRL